mmetsp:Transcript_1970/g.5185  ORF Transcript_1970/g.5185 Transcript_1970/m.5185 type:complete len:115 (-) Transcript_1970:74-418(-)|eukprot:CAMPEP_0185833430 /NCGR_PEP_ID=MMETSP1353-20130828/2802_1 /TAXON_ID=1077150 /ORGANISM="Erythrolobus australicus, Strain CCMP3124" /LENGTH=114 /DNA_ID=CAMNT_0028531719 /DNA_START=32 /DNA_END=376 /DNA_ORIENTATION=+
MKYVSAYLLLQLGGNASPSAADVSKVLSAAGADVDEDEVAKLCDQLKDKSIEEVMDAGKQKFSSVPVGGGGGGGGGGGSGAAAGGGSSAPAAAAEPEPAAEEEEEEDLGFGLFD